MAVGAAVEDIRRLVFRQGMTPVATGLPSRAGYIAGSEPHSAIPASRCFSIRPVHHGNRASGAHCDRASGMLSARAPGDRGRPRRRVAARLTLRSVGPSASHESSRLAGQDVESFGEVPRTSLLRIETREVAKDLFLSAGDERLPILPR